MTLKQTINVAIIGFVLFCSSFFYVAFRISLDQDQIARLPKYMTKIVISGYVIDIPRISKGKPYIIFYVTNGYYSGYKFLIFYQLTQIQQLWNFNRNYSLSVSLYQQYGNLLSIVKIYGNHYSIYTQINNLRFNLFQYINKIAANNNFKGVFLSLIVGNHDYIDESQWPLFCSLGIIHLVSISGLHIRIIYSWWQFIIRFIYYFLVIKIWSYGIKGKRIWPNPIDVYSMSSIIVIVFYGLLVGLSVVASRAVWFIVLFEIANLLRIYISKFDLLLLTTTLLILWHPNDLSNGGAWISCIIVFIAFYMSDCYSDLPIMIRNILTKSMMSLSVLPLSIWCFNTMPWAGLPVNLIAIPVVGELLTPILFLATILHLDYLVLCIMKLLALSLNLLTKISILQEIPYRINDIKTIILSYLGLIILIIPNLVKLQKTFAVVLFSSIFFSRTIFDNDEVNLIIIPHHAQAINASTVGFVDVLLIYQHIAYLLLADIDPDNQYLINKLREYKIYKVLDYRNNRNSVKLATVTINHHDQGIITIINKGTNNQSGIIIAYQGFPVLAQNYNLQQLVYINSHSVCANPENNLAQHYKKIFIFHANARCFDKLLDNFNLIGVNMVNGMNNEINVISTAA